MARIQNTGKVNHAGTSSQASFASPVTTGNFISLLVGGAGATLDFNTGDFADNQSSNTYSLGVKTAVDAGNRSRASIFYVKNVNSNGGTFTITLTTNVSCDLVWSAQEHSNIDTTSPLDQTQVNRGTADPINTGTTGTTVQADELICAVCILRVTETTIVVEVVVPTWTQEHEELSFTLSEPGEGDSRYVTATGTQSCSWTEAPSTPGNGWSACIATFKVSGGSPPPSAPAVPRGAFFQRPIFHR